LLVLGLAAWSSIDLSALPPYRWLPHVYLALLVFGILFSWVTDTGRKRDSMAECHDDCSCAKN